MQPATLCGGFKAMKAADEESRSLVNSFKETIQTRLNKQFQTFEVVGYTTQVVAGTNYKIKVKVDNDEHVHIKVFRPLPYTGMPPELKEVDGGKKAEDAL